MTCRLKHSITLLEALKDGGCGEEGGGAGEVYILESRLVECGR